MARIVVTEFMDDVAVGMLRARHDVVYDETFADRRDALQAAVAQADALIVRNRTRVDAALAGAAQRLVAVGRLGVGLDNIDVAACKRRGIEVIPATGANALAVAEYVIATAMLLLRGAYRATGEVAAGGWPRTALSAGREIHGKTLGLVGFGGIGRATAGLARALGMTVVAHDPALDPGASLWHEHAATPLALDELFARADVVSLHVPLVDATRNLVDARRLALMKPGAVLVNTARGGVVDEAALAAALRAGRPGSAAIDVFANEPLAQGSPLADAPNLLLTPHIAGVTVESNTRVSAMIAERVDAVLRSKRPG